MTGPTFYLGAHHPSWLWNGEMDGLRLFVSHNRLKDRKSPFPAATVPGWALDSMGFSVLQRHGRWTVTPAEYAAATARYMREIGRLEWAAGQDHMCEQAVIYGGTWGGQQFAGTRQFIDPAGRLPYEQLVRVHQRLTVENCVALENVWPQFSAGPCPYKPTLQGRVGDPGSYLEHAAMYEAAGIHLADYTLVGVGSVCRLQSDKAIGNLARGLAPLGLNLHWFGLKATGLPYVWPHIWSHDSQAWGAEARRGPRMDGCTHVRVRGKYVGQPSSCANCPRKARAWAHGIAGIHATLARRGYQPALDGNWAAGVYAPATAETRVAVRQQRAARDQGVLWEEAS
jgi:hypothetical protein